MALTAAGGRDTVVGLAAGLETAVEVAATAGFLATGAV
jgi:hypothetical protein